MSITVSIESQLRSAMAQLEELRDRDLPFIAQEAINKTLYQVKSDLRTDMEQLFDRPTAFTLNSMMVWPEASKIKLEGELGFRDFAGKGNAAGSYLAPQIEGGGRNLKKFEKQLQNAGLLPRGLFTTPASAGGPENKGAPLDVHGNIPGSYLMAVLSYLRANRDGTQNRSTTKKQKGASRGVQWFVINDNKNGLPLGIYERKAGAFHMVIKFVSAPNYEVRFPASALALASAERHAPAQIADAADFALRALRRNRAKWEAEDRKR